LVLATFVEKLGTHPMPKRLLNNTNVNLDVCSMEAMPAISNKPKRFVAQSKVKEHGVPGNLSLTLKECLPWTIM
jgi:hypothetical protein